MFRQDPRDGSLFRSPSQKGHKLAELPGDRIFPKSARMFVGEMSSRKNNSRLIMLETWTHTHKKKGSELQPHFEKLLGNTKKRSKTGQIPKISSWNVLPTKNPPSGSLPNAASVDPS